MDNYYKTFIYCIVVFIWMFFAGVLFYFYVYDNDEYLITVEYNISEPLFDNSDTGDEESDQAHESEANQVDDQEDSANQGYTVIVKD